MSRAAPRAPATATRNLVDAADEAPALSMRTTSTPARWTVSSGQPGLPSAHRGSRIDGDRSRCLATPPRSIVRRGATPYGASTWTAAQGSLIDQRDHRISRDDHPRGRIAGFNVVYAAHAPRVRYTRRELAGAARRRCRRGRHGVVTRALDPARNARRLRQVDLGAGSDQLDITWDLAEQISGRVTADLRRGFTLDLGTSRCAADRERTALPHRVPRRPGARERRANTIYVGGACNVRLDGDRGPIGCWSTAQRAVGRSSCTAAPGATC